ncbi:hypothetical protein ABRY23_02900 [Melioribacteraceae bacterium 4301-Me]|uniref:hypothetical protein n=1 Tax=Pyranulibacter aquaticus TaxID=3163344 RepID=UPI003595FD3A
MKKFFLTPFLTAVILVTFSCNTQQTDVTQPAEVQKSLSKFNSTNCTTIQSGTLHASDGSVLTTGYDKWGYNYQAHIFNGKYCDAYRNAAWCQDYKDVNLQMKWNDAWLSNTDCDGDGLLDRHFGFSSYRGSGAWLTNHMSGTYIVDGKKCQWTYFVKIVAVPLDAYLSNGIWYNSNGSKIGPVIWNEFAIIEEVSNDPCAGQHGLQFVSPDHAGLEGW